MQFYYQHEEDSEEGDRAYAVKQKCTFVINYRYDTEEELWCEVIMGVSFHFDTFKTQNNFNPLDIAGVP
jgi:hypothetical protein